MGTSKRKPQRVTASQLAELVVCERKSVFRARCGWRPNVWRSAKLAVGVAAHERFRREGDEDCPVAPRLLMWVGLMLAMALLVLWVAR
jgi:hypothetical protein